MALTAAVVERTPQRLLYLVTQDGGGGTTMTIPNQNAGTPDLGADSLTDTPLGDVMQRRRDTGVPLIQAEARALLFGDNALGNGSVLGGGTGPNNGVTGDFNAPRCHVYFTARDGFDGWIVDANVDGDGDPILNLIGPAGASHAYLEIVYSDSAET